MKFNLLMMIWLIVFFGGCSTTSLKKVEHERALRGKIITDDNVTLSYTKEYYYFAFLKGAFSETEFSTLIDKFSIEKALNKNKIFNKKILASRYFKKIPNVKYTTIAYKIDDYQLEKIKTILDDFREEKDYTYGFYGENRMYPYADMLTPYIGNFYLVSGRQGCVYVKGNYGLEKYYNSTLTSDEHTPEDIYLNIDFKLQQALEKELSLKKVDMNATEVMSIVLDPNTFDIKSIASSNRYDPKHIVKGDILNASANSIRYLFELNNYISPINKAIKKEKYLTLEDGYKKFGFYEKSGIDLSYEQVARATKQVNLVQLLKMYAVFYSGGKISNPTIVKQEAPKSFKQIISKENALEIKNTLGDFFKQMPSDSVLLNVKNQSGYINIKEIEIDKQKLLQIYLTVNAEK